MIEACWRIPKQSKAMRTYAQSGQKKKSVVHQWQREGATHSAVNTVRSLSMMEIRSRFHYLRCEYSLYLTVLDFTQAPCFKFLIQIQIWFAFGNPFQAWWPPCPKGYWSSLSVFYSCLASRYFFCSFQLHAHHLFV